MLYPLALGKAAYVGILRQLAPALLDHSEFQCFATFDGHSLDPILGTRDNSS